CRTRERDGDLVLVGDVFRQVLARDPLRGCRRRLDERERVVALEHVGLLGEPLLVVALDEDLEDSFHLPIPSHSTRPRSSRVAWPRWSNRRSRPGTRRRRTSSSSTAAS